MCVYTTRTASRPRMTEAEIVKMRNLRTEGWTIHEIAREIGCGSTVVGTYTVGCGNSRRKVGNIVINKREGVEVKGYRIVPMNSMSRPVVPVAVPVGHAHPVVPVPAPVIRSEVTECLRQNGTNIVEVFAIKGFWHGMVRLSKHGIVYMARKVDKTYIIYGIYNSTLDRLEMLIPQVWEQF